MDKKKYIIEVEEDPHKIRLLKMKNGESGLPCMQFIAATPYTEKEAYQKGLYDAWECARKIAINEASGGLSLVELDKIFSCDDLAEVFGFTASEAIEKIRQYEQKQQIAIGDEVVFYNGERCVVTVVEDGQVVEVMDENGLSMKMDDGLRNSMKKTGRHFEELVTILKKMKGE